MVTLGYVPPFTFLDIQLTPFRSQYPSLSPFTPTCHSTPHLSSLPSPPFPPGYLSSNLSLQVRDQAKSSWWDRRALLRECEAAIPSGTGQLTEDEEEGWRFVRLGWEGVEGTAVGVGWGVYEIWLGGKGRNE